MTSQPLFVALGAALALALGLPETMAQSQSATTPSPLIDIGAGRTLRLARFPDGPGAMEIGAQLFPGLCDYFDDYSSYTLTDLTNPPGSLVPFNGQLNPAGVTFGSSDFFGAADESVLTSVGAMAPSGVPPHGLATPRFALSARGILNTGYNPSLAVMATYRHGLFFPTPDNPVIVSQDVYLESSDGQPRTTIWWSPVSFPENSIYDRVFFGGTNLQGELAGFANMHGVTDRFLSLGPRPGGGQSFYASASTTLFPFPVNQWFTLMAHTNVNAAGAGGYSVWIKTHETALADPPFIDPRMASGDIPPIDGDPVGWVNTYPGKPDNIVTSLVREGIGFAQNAMGDVAPLTGLLSQAPIFDSPNFNGIQYGWGFDDPLDANFQPDNYFFANYCVRGVFFPPTCLADFSGDGLVNGQDLATLLVNWGQTGGFGPTDLNADGVINGADLAILLTTWGPCF